MWLMRSVRTESEKKNKEKTLKTPKFVIQDKSYMYVVRFFIFVLLEEDETKKRRFRGVFLSPSWF